MMTVYIPMTLWHALAFLRDRKTVFAQLIPQQKARKAQRKPLPGELVIGDSLIGYQERQAAIDAGRLTIDGELALVHIVYSRALHERLAYEGKIRGTDKHQQTGAAQWLVTAAGCPDLEREASFLMEVIPAQTPQPEPAPAREFGGGPTGWGGC